MAIDFSASMTNALSELIKHVQRSLVMVHNGRHSVGTGILWRRGGFILTNQHVLGRKKRVRVTLEDGSEALASVLAREAEIDLVLLQVELPDLPVALIADSREVKVGQIVLAVGHPWGQRGVVTAGIISGLGSATTRRKGEKLPIFRSDVTLAPGNSGGPLVNTLGGVIGINTMIVGGDLGVAIPSQVAEGFVTQALGEQAQVRV
ncbi:MAG: trypsin-like peptidase domain-containing protein [Anaerolineales bacterium]|nr:trypsin-like peptidase domain-containing protein [Anaerolineales bacterium]